MKRERGTGGAKLRSFISIEGTRRMSRILRGMIYRRLQIKGARDSFPQYKAYLEYIHQIEYLHVMLLIISEY